VWDLAWREASAWDAAWMRPPKPLAWDGPAAEPPAPRLTLPEAPLDAALLGGGGGVCLGTPSGAALLAPLQDARIVRARQASPPPPPGPRPAIHAATKEADGPHLQAPGREGGARRGKRAPCPRWR